MSRLLLVALAAALLSGCQSDESPAGNDDSVVSRKPIEVSVHSVGTRSFANTDKLWIWADKSADDDFIKAWPLTYDGSSFVPTTTYYWPQNATTLTFKAIYGNFTSNPTESVTMWTGLQLKHKVISNQTSESDRQKSDLLFKKTSANNGVTVDLKLEHQLSMVTIVLKKEDGSGISAATLQNAVVTLEGAQTTTTFNSSDLSTTSSGSAETITMGGSGLNREAIIPCQSATLTLKVKLNDFPATSKSRTFTCTLPNTDFEKGQNYQYTLKLNNNISVTLASTAISSWTDETVGLVIPPAAVAGS